MKTSDLSKSQQNSLIFLRLFIGWHFLYEGFLKAYNPSWTARGFLLNAQGPFQNLFAWLADDGIISIINFLNIFGLIAIGIALVIGFIERPAAIAGIVLLLLYYLAQPPFMDVSQAGMEGNYWIINKNLIEATALLVLYNFPTARAFGIERLFGLKKDVTPKPNSHG